MIFRIPIKARNDVYFSIATTKLPKLSKNPCKMFLNTKNASHMLKITTTYGEVQNKYEENTCGGFISVQSRCDALNSYHAILLKEGL